MNRPLKTLFLMEDLCFGGTQKQNLALANRLDPGRFAAEILTFSGITDLDSEVHVPLRHLGAKRGPDPFFFYKIGTLLRKLAPDILIPCTALPNIWGRIWAKVLKIPVVLGTCRGGGAPVRQHERFLWRLTDHIVCNSQALVEVMEEKGIPLSHLSYIPNGVDCEHFWPGEKVKTGKLILCVARLAPDKDLGSLLKAFALLAEQDVELRLRIVGDGPEEKSLRESIAKLPSAVGARIELAGPSDDPAHHYQEADIFVLSSIREGQPNVILEAMSSGLPICASEVGGIPDLLRAGSGGLLSPPKNVAKLAANIERLLADSALRQVMGQDNRKYVLENFSFAQMVSSHEKILETLWAQKAPVGK